MKQTIYTYVVTKGDYKGREVKSYDSLYKDVGLGLIAPIPLVCHDDDNEYMIYADYLKLVKEDVIEFDDNEVRKMLSEMGASDDFIEDVISGKIKP